MTELSNIARTWDALVRAEALLARAQAALARMNAVLEAYAAYKRAHESGVRTKNLCTDVHGC